MGRVSSNLTLLLAIAINVFLYPQSRASSFLDAGQSDIIS